MASENVKLSPGQVWRSMRAGSLEEVTPKVEPESEWEGTGRREQHAQRRHLGVLGTRLDARPGCLWGLETGSHCPSPLFVPS